MDKLLKKTIEHILDNEIDKWPPECPIFAFQPERPYYYPKSSEFEEKTVETEILRI